MKYEEFHQKIKRAGWKHVNSRLNRRIYEKNGQLRSIAFYPNMEIGRKTLKSLKTWFGIR